MKKIAIGLILLLFFLSVYSVGSFIGSNYAYKPTPVTAVTPTKPVELKADKLWSLIQDWRESQGLQPYIEDQRLCKIAEDRVDDKDYSHEQFMVKYDTSEYPYAMQENLVWNAMQESDALEWWLNSPPHRATLEKPYTHSCLATDKNYAVQIFSSF